MVKVDPFLESPELAQLEILLKTIRDRYNKSAADAVGAVTHHQDIPVSIFSSSFGPLETLVIYLKEHGELTFQEISSALNRSQKSLWQTYKNARAKSKERLNIYSKQTVSLRIFSDRTLSIQEHYVVDLRKQGLGFTQIGKLVHRDPRTIWTSYSKAMKKMRGESNE